VAGESAVIVPVLQADGLLRGLRPRWQPAAPVGIPAHITLAYPFLTAEELGPDALTGLAAIFGAQPPLPVRLAGVGRWPGIAYLAPEPAEPFVALAEAVQAAFPSARTAGRGEGALVPHVTALRHPDEAVLGEAAAELAARLPLDVLIAEAWLVQAAGEGRAWLVGEGAGERWTLRMRFPLGLNRY
jgi:2'-5' RNA ligase